MKRKNVDDWIKGRVTNDIDIMHKSSSGKIFYCDVTQLDISATNIRKQLLKGNSCSYLMPEKVCDYLNKHKLYRT